MTELEGSQRPGATVWVAAVATVLLFAAGCWIGGRLVLGAAGSEEPVSAGQYSAVLTETDASIREPFARLRADLESTRAATAGAATIRAAADRLRAGADRLDRTTAPGPVAAAQDSLARALRDLADVVEQAGGGSWSCPAAAPLTVVLQSTAAERVRAKAAQLRAADPGYAFGAFLPAAPPEQNRRLKNGAFVKKRSGDGSGELRVENGKGGADTLVSLVKGGKPVFTVYVRGGGAYTVDGVLPGKYQIFLASGTDWEAKRKGFTRDCSFTRFDDDFRFAPSGTRWEIELTQRSGGNATTIGVAPDAFPVG